MLSMIVFAVGVCLFFSGRVAFGVGKLFVLIAFTFTAWEYPTLCIAVLAMSVIAGVGMGIRDAKSGKKITAKSEMSAYVSDVKSCDDGSVEVDIQIKNLPFDIDKK